VDSLLLLWNLTWFMHSCVTTCNNLFWGLFATLQLPNQSDCRWHCRISRPSRLKKTKFCWGSVQNSISKCNILHANNRNFSCFGLKQKKNDTCWRVASRNRSLVSLKNTPTENRQNTVKWRKKISQHYSFSSTSDMLKTHCFTVKRNKVQAFTGSLRD